MSVEQEAMKKTITFVLDMEEEHGFTPDQIMSMVNLVIICRDLEHEEAKELAATAHAIIDEVEAQTTDEGDDGKEDDDEDEDDDKGDE